MRVIEVTQSRPAEIFIQRHVDAMMTTGFPVELLARHGREGFAEAASIEDLEPSPMGTLMPNFDHLRVPEKLLNIRYLRLSRRSFRLRDQVVLGYFESLDPDLIHFHDAHLAASMCWIPRALGVPYTLSLRGSDLQVTTLRGTAHRHGVVSAIEGAAGVHAVCAAMGQGAEKLVGHGLESAVIYTTIPIPPSLPARRAPAGTFHLISVGRLMWRKGFHHLLVGLRHMLDRNIRATLTIVGSGPDLDELLYLRNALNLESVVEMPGKLSYPQIMRLFETADAYVQSSVAEGLSNSLAEAMANGLPAFATDVGGTRELVQDGITGFLLPPLSPQAWPDSLMRVLDAAEMENVRGQAFARVSEMCSPLRHSTEFRAFYMKAAGGTMPQPAAA